MHHIGQARGGNGTTTALHECASMRGERAQPSEGYFETAWLLMAAGASPFTERSDGERTLSLMHHHYLSACDPAVVSPAAEGEGLRSL